MRIVISGYACRPSGNTEGANAFHLAHELALRGHEVTILTREQDYKATVRALRELDLAQGTVTAVSIAENRGGLISRTLIDRGRYRAYRRYAAWQVRAANWMRSHRGDFDVAHHASWSSISLPIAVAFSGLHFVLGPIGGGQTLHPDLYMWLDGADDHERTRNRVIRSAVPRNPLSRWAASHAGVFLAANYETAQLGRALGAKHVALMMPDGVRRGEISTHPPKFPRAKEIVWVGRFKTFKGAGLAAGAFRRVVASHPDARLTFIGDGPTRTGVMESCSDLVASGHVRFLGLLPWALGQGVLKQARVHLFTSIRESFGAQVLEAAANGIPTVGLDAYGLKTFCQGPGFKLVEPLPADRLDSRIAAALDTCLDWSEERWMFESDGARNLAEANTYQRKAESIEAMFSRVNL